MFHWLFNFRAPDWNGSSGDLSTPTSRLPWVRRTPPNLSRYDSVFKTLITLDSLKNGRVLVRSGSTPANLRRSPVGSGSEFVHRRTRTHHQSVKRSNPRLCVGSTLNRYLISAGRCCLQGECQPMREPMLPVYSAVCGRKYQMFRCDATQHNTTHMQDRSS